MSENEPVVLGDRNLYPTDEIIFSIIGEKKIIWQRIMNHVMTNYQNITSEWRYYNDGKQWLFKMQQKKKTLFWISLLNDTFRITFYFGDKALPLIAGSTLSQEIKENFKNAKHYGSIRPVTILISGTRDFDNISKLVDIKTKLK